jgi:hypothetical protein
MLISISGMSGIAPAIAPHMLATNQARIAQNCRLWSGGLEPIRDYSLTYATGMAGPLKSIYRFLSGSATDDKYWFAWDKEVNVVKGAVSGDTDERTYFTGTGRPRKTSISIGALNATPYPGASLEMGVPRPVLAPVVTAVGGGNVAGEVQETRSYVYTYLTSFGDMDEESFPSPAVTVTGYPSSTWTVSGLQAMPSGGFNFKSVRIYRVSTGNASSSYLLAAERTSLGGFQDTVAATALGNPLPSLDWDSPPGTSGNTDETRELRGLTAMPNGVNAGFVGSDVYLSPAYRPHTFPQAYMNSVNYPVVALAPLQQNLLVLTTGQPYSINTSDPANTSPENVNFSQACAASRSVAEFGNGVIYASPDGLVYVGIDGARNLTDGVFTREQWQKLNPASMHGCQHDGRYYGWFSGATLPNAPAQGGFVLDSKSFTLTDVYADACFADLIQDALFIAIGSTIYKWEASATLRPYLWQSKTFQPPRPTNFGFGQVIADDYSNVTFKLYADDTLIHMETVTSDEPFPLPSDALNTRFEIGLTGTSRVTLVSIAESLTELGGV